MRKLVDLNPRWVGAGGEGVSNVDGSPVPERRGVGVSFDCPCQPCTTQRTGGEADFYLRVFVGFANPLDGGPAHDPRQGAQWQRTGETFETLTLTPSIQRHRVGDGGCDWHGFVTNGEVTGA